MVEVWTVRSFNCLNRLFSRPAPCQRTAIERRQIRITAQRRFSQGNGLRQRLRRRMGIGGASRDMVVPTPADRIVEQDTLETMVAADRPAARGRDLGQGVTRQPEPGGFELIA
jgi:hypothetical protein